MMAELVTRGPIACTIAVTEEFEAYTTGVFQDKTGAKVYTCVLLLRASYGIEAYCISVTSGV